MLCAMASLQWAHLFPCPRSFSHAHAISEPPDARLRIEMLSDVRRIAAATGPGIVLAALRLALAASALTICEAQAGRDSEHRARTSVG